MTKSDEIAARFIARRVRRVQRRWRGARPVVSSFDTLWELEAVLMPFTMPEAPRNTLPDRESALRVRKWKARIAQSRCR